MGSSKNINEAYRTTEFAYRIVESKIGCIIALLLVPAGVSLDYFIYPNFLTLFFFLRLLCDIVIGIVFALHFTNIGQKNIKALTFTWLISVQIMICYMIFLTDGYNSTYYAGLNLAIIAIGILLPTSVIEAIVFSSTTIFLYILACYYHPDSIDFNTLYNNLYFLTLTSIIGITSVFFNVRRRFTEFRLSFELDNRNKELTEIDQQKSLFFANVSHELRTPLTLILSPIQDLLLKPTVSNEIKNTLSIVANNAVRLLKLVNDLLDIVRLEEGKTPLYKTPAELNKTVGGLADSVSHLAHSKNIKLIKHLSEKSLVVTADQQALEKIFLNLLINAIKFTNANGCITVSSYLDSANAQAVVEIKDTGMGISATELPHIFERFRQANGASTRAHQGTGLGLAIVKELTEALGGQIKAMSSPGNGTTMRISFPLCQDPTLTTVDALLPPLSNNYLADPLAGAHKTTELNELAPNNSINQFVQDDTDKPLLLLIDDEPDMQRYLISILQDDYRLLYASNGKQGLDLFSNHHPDLVLLDLMLPEIDGLEVCRIIKQYKKHTKVILLTARADETTKIEALKRGADDFLTKPFSSLEINTRLNNLFHTSQLQRDLQQQNMELQKTLKALKHAQSQLIQSEKMNALGNLAAGLLHEINNPLNYTLTALQVAMNAPLILQDQELLEICEDMQEGMLRISTIVTDLRAFAYPSDMSMHTPFLFSAILEKALRFTTIEINELVIDQRGCKDIWVTGSETHITQVLINLISNAGNAISKAQREIPGTIIIDCRTEKKRLYIRVKDNGIGIEKEIISQIFDPFFTTQEVGDGMGLGLSISNTIVTNHGGKFVVDSKPNEGTTITFDLGLAD